MLVVAKLTKFSGFQEQPSKVNGRRSYQEEEDHLPQHPTTSMAGSLFNVSDLKADR